MVGRIDKTAESRSPYKKQSTISKNLDRNQHPHRKIKGVSEFEDNEEFGKEPNKLVHSDSDSLFDEIKSGGQTPE